MEIYRNHQNVTLFVKENDIFFHIIDQKVSRISSRELPSLHEGSLEISLTVTAYV